MRWINRSLDGCVVEHEDDIRFPSAVELLAEIDSILRMLRVDGQIVHQDVSRHCVTCGVGSYQLLVHETSGPQAVHNFGLNQVGGQGFRIFRCDRCGHVQIFQMNPTAPA